MNTATVTWINFENNGTYLQAYALQQTILSLGHNNVIIDDLHIQNANTLKPNINFYIWKCIAWFTSLFHPAPPSVIEKTKPFYTDFRRRYLKIYGQQDYTNRFDIYICGSDQIWSPYLPFDGYYFLDFTSKKKIAYAPSVGTNTCSEDYRENVKKCLSSFSHISTREKAGKELLSTITDKPIKVVLDPTLLLRKEDWKKLTEPSAEEDYIFCYFLTLTPWYVDFTEEYARKHGMKIKIFYTNTALYKKHNQNIVYGGPKEFLSNIKSAKLIFTDSFHATVFSLIFHRDFITFKRFKDGGEKDQNARLYNLLTPVNLLNRFIGNQDLQNVENRAEIDYISVDSIIEEIRLDSLQYLRDSINND